MLSGNLQAMRCINCNRKVPKVSPRSWRKDYCNTCVRKGRTGAKSLELLKAMKDGRDRETKTVWFEI